MMLALRKNVLSNAAMNWAKAKWRQDQWMSTKTPELKVVVVGCSGGVGQPTTMLLKRTNLIDRLNLVDLKNTKGIAVDVSQIDTKGRIKYYYKHEELGEAMCGANIIVLLPGVARQGTQTRDDLFKDNAKTIHQICTVIARVAPNAITLIVTNPVNSLVPMAIECMRAASDEFCPSRVLGVTTIDLVRASTYLGEVVKVNPADITVWVIGGHSPHTMVPLWSSSQPEFCLPDDCVKALTKRLRDAGTEVLLAKDGKETSHLVAAHAICRMVKSVIRALDCNNECPVVEVAYVLNPDGCPKYMALPVILGENGVAGIECLPPLCDTEQCLLDEAIKVLEGEVAKGENYACELCTQTPAMSATCEVKTLKPQRIGVPAELSEACKPPPKGDRNKCKKRNLDPCAKDKKK